MQAFAKVAELGSFTRAADELGLSRAMVSTHVQRLERRFGLKLLNRTTRKVALTPAGGEYLEHCRRVFVELAAAEETLRRGKEQPTGRVRVDVPGSFGRHILLPALPEFLSRYPGIDLDLRFNERVVDLVARRRRSRRARRHGDGPRRRRAPGIRFTLDHLRLARLSRPPRAAADASRTSPTTC